MFFLIFFAGFFTFWLIGVVGRYLVRKSADIKEFYAGLAPLAWIGMWLIRLGMPLVRMRQCKVLRYEGRVWISPDVPGMRIKDG